MSRSFNACPVDSPAKLSSIPLPATMTAAHLELFPAARGHPWLVIKLPRQCMDVTGRGLAPMEEDTTKDHDDDDDSLAECLSIVIRSQVK